MRKIIFQNEYYYHIYNRGVDKRQIFMDQKDHHKFFTSIVELNNLSTHEQRAYYKRKDIRELSSHRELSSLMSFLANLPPLVTVVAYALVKNHYHFILRQEQKKGVETFMHRIGTAYTNLTNNKLKRSGSLFQGPYKAIHVRTEEYLRYLSSYINGNIEIHDISTAINYKWSSYQDYLGIRKDTICDYKDIMNQFKSIEEYQEYTAWVIKYAKNMKDQYKKLTLE